MRWGEVMRRGLFWFAAAAASLALGGSALAGDEKKCAHVCILKYQDQNKNAANDGERPLRDVTFKVKVPGTTAPKSVITDKTGRACVWGPAGKYVIEEVTPAGWTVTTGAVKTVTAVAGQTTLVEFGNWPESRLCVRKFHDRNGDGIKGKNEPWLGADHNGRSFYVLIMRPDGFKDYAPLKNGKGHFCYPAPPGTYRIVECARTGWTPTTADTQTITLAAGQNGQVIFGNRRCRTKQQVAVGAGR